MSDGGPHEANFLKLDCNKLKETFAWLPRWNVKQTIEKIVEFELLRLQGKDKEELSKCMEAQIKEYIECQI